MIQLVQILVIHQQLIIVEYQNSNGQLEYCHTTGWGVSTRLIGGVIMTHGDDDGLRLPPAISPHQIIIIPIMKGTDEDAQVIEYAEFLSNS